MVVRGGAAVTRYWLLVIARRGRGYSLLVMRGGAAVTRYWLLRGGAAVICYLGAAITPKGELMVIARRGRGYSLLVIARHCRG